ncbi:MAG: hypothetical protein E7603_09715 [Ruminococcaceae bacterium]|nr:hypothetical protein [Oscillospiraceae bacterium]
MSKFLKWLDNYWYHYKWHTIIVAFFLIIGIISTVQIFNRETYDAYVMYVGGEEIPDTKYYDIMQSLKAVSSDYDGNKEHKINFGKMAFISDPENNMASTINSPTVQFLSNLVVQPYYIYLMDVEVYKLYKDSGVFVPISELMTDVPEDWYYDETAVYFDKTDYANSFAGVDKLGENTLLVIKIMPYASSKRVAAAERTSYENHLDMLKNILSYRKNG